MDCRGTEHRAQKRPQEMGKGDCFLNPKKRWICSVCPIIPPFDPDMTPYEDINQLLLNKFQHHKMLKGDLSWLRVLNR